MQEKKHLLSMILASMILHDMMYELNAVQYKAKSMVPNIVMLIITLFVCLLSVYRN